MGQQQTPEHERPDLEPVYGVRRWKRSPFDIVGQEIAFYSDGSVSSFALSDKNLQDEDMLRKLLRVGLPIPGNTDTTGHSKIIEARIINLLQATGPLRDLNVGSLSISDIYNTSRTLLMLEALREAISEDQSSINKLLKVKKGTPKSRTVSLRDSGKWYGLGFDISGVVEIEATDEVEIAIAYLSEAVTWLMSTADITFGIEPYFSEHRKLATVPHFRPVVRFGDPWGLLMYAFFRQITSTRAVSGCKFCGQPMRAGRLDKETCSERCRKGWYRARKREG